MKMSFGNTETSFEFKMAQTLRRSHCDRPEAAHECVGEVTIKRGEVCLNCGLCGKGEDIPGWDSTIDEVLRPLFCIAGIDWDSLDLSARSRAVRHYKKMVRDTNGKD